MLIRRQGSLLYARAYKRLALAALTVYLVAGCLLALFSIALFDTIIAGAATFGLVGAAVLALWLFYRAILWAFERESHQSVELTDEGVRETHRGHEWAFIPWEGVNEIEFDATIVAGASLRLKGNFSEIAISNVDLVITSPMRIREMHKALGQSRPMIELLRTVRARAPNAELKMNRLARKRMGRYDLAAADPTGN